MKRFVFTIVRLALVLSLATLGTQFASDRTQKTGGQQFFTFDYPGAVSTFAAGINSGGDIVGSYWDPVASHGFILCRGAFQTLDFPDPTMPHTVPRAITPGGGIIVGAVINQLWSTYHGFVWRGGNFETILFPGADYTYAMNINPQGDIVGEYYLSDFVIHGFLYSSGTYTTIDAPTPDAAHTSIYAINARGDIAGWYANADFSSLRAFAVTKGRLTVIETPPDSNFMIATGINDRGDVVGYYGLSDFTSRGFLWSEGILSSIEIPGSIGTRCNGINARGDIVGEYDTPDYVTHGFVLFK